MDNMHLVTGFLGYEHIKATDQAAFNAALIGTGQFVLDKGGVFEAQVISNNQVRILDGELMMQGRFVRLDPGTYVDLAVDNGEQGKNRNDLVVVRYTKDTGTAVESVNLVVIKGEAVDGEAVDPAYTEGDITNGSAVLHEYPLWRLPLEGINVGTPVALFGEPFADSMLTLPGIRQSVETIHNEVNEQLETFSEEVDERIAGIDSYTKSETLSTETKALFGLGEDAVPDQALEQTSKLFQYWWKRAQLIPANIELGELEEYRTMTSSGASGTTYKFEYSSEIAISSDGEISLIGTIESISVSYTNYTPLKNLLGKYALSGFDNLFYYIPSDAKYRQLHESGVAKTQIDSYRLTGNKDMISNNAEYVNSANRNEYPDDVVVDGYFYTYVGQPYKNAVTSTRIETGTYIGTGVCGSGTPNILTFEFKPKYVVVHHPNSAYYGGFIWPYGSSGVRVGGGTSNYAANAKWDGNTVSFYSASAEMQLNLGGVEYRYFYF